MTKASAGGNVARTRPAHPFARTGFGLLRLAAAVLVFVALVTQITDQVLNDAFVPGEYFSLFTIQTSIINILVLTVAGISALRRTRDSELLTSARMSIVSYAVVTAVVHAALLRGIPDDGFVGLWWPKEIQHVLIPIVILIDWLFAPGRAPLAWRRLWFALAYPLAWVAFTLLRGLATGWYPYPFLDAGGPGGWGAVLVYVVGITAFVVLIAAAAIGVSRISRR